MLYSFDAIYAEQVERGATHQHALKLASQVEAVEGLLAILVAAEWFDAIEDARPVLGQVLLENVCRDPQSESTPASLVVAIAAKIGRNLEDPLLAEINRQAH
jgi:hypothetical protein